MRIGVLAGLFVVAGLLAWAGARLWNALGTLPNVPVAAPIVLAVIATILFATGLSIRARLKAQRERDPEAKGVDPMQAARAVVLGQASAYVAALVGGAYGGFGLFLVLDGLDYGARQRQAVYALLSVVAGVLVVAAAIFVERVCKLPDDEDDPHRPAL
jgi:Mg2+/citrate symporter